MDNKWLQSKWQDYLFLTVEMKKFLLKNNLDMFFSLLDQRGELQSEIARHTSAEYAATVDGKQLLQRVQAANEELRQSFLTIFNAMRNRENIMQQYEGIVNFAGSYLNKRT
jgi:hypothetical protein